MRDSASWPSRKEFWTNNAHARRLFDPTFQLSDEIDDEIEALEDVLAQVKRLRNDRKPAVSRLPPEVLAAVFIDVRDSSTAEQLEAEMARRSSWLPVTKVCHHWREVSMHTHTLWTDILLPPMSRQSIENAAKHAGSTPLSVYYRYSDKYKDAYILDAYSIDNLQPARIRTMKAAIYDEKCLALERPMPALETLELTNERGWFQVDCDLGTFFPRLSSLSIHNCLMSWDSTVFSQLYYLSLTFGRNESHFVPLASIHGLFRRLSRVHTINLQHFRADYFSLTSRERVVLPPSLSSLHITEREDANHLFEFVQGIVRQEHTRITIDVRGCDPDSIDFEPAVNGSFAHHLGPDSPAALSLMTEEDRREDREFTQMTISIGVRRTGWPSPPSSTSWEPIPDDDIRISWNLFSEDSPDEYSELEMDDLGISVDDVLDLSLDFSPGESAFEENGFESELLARASKVQRLHTSEQSLALLVEILKGGDPDSPSSPGNFLLPHLDTLCVVPSKMKPKPKYAELAEYLDTRKRAGFAVRELQVPLEEPKDAVDGAQGAEALSKETRVWGLLRDSVSVLRYSREGYY